ncbi:hypothetical protein [Rhizorhapis sp. SPR117]|uniref:hypothetical protein n=1 Tax=Rhizorhapis sp. SPR117 TaxID=2912611 RepID=UPI000A48122C|nr:hypothetical protein [Rhizorhapis sp. SPR117]
MFEPTTRENPDWAMDGSEEPVAESVEAPEAEISSKMARQLLMAAGVVAILAWR